MNDRIKELERECWEPRKHPVSQAAMGDKFNTEKFAALIVRECMSVIGEENYGMLTGKANCTKIKRHFGVKE